jgi:hypothetical protein
MSHLLELAIGVVLVWLLLSIVLSVVNEALALIFRIRSKHLWLAIGRILQPTLVGQRRKLLETVIILPLDDGSDLRPTAQPGFADESTTSRTRTDPHDPALRPVQESLQRIYNELAPSLTEVALNGRRTKTTAIPSQVLAEAIARVARTTVLPNDLLIAAKRLGWVGPELSKLRGWVASKDALTPIDRKTFVTELVDGATPVERPILFDTAASILTLQDLHTLFGSQPALQQAFADLFRIKDLRQRAEALTVLIRQRIDREFDQLNALYRRQSRKVLGILAIPLVIGTEANAITLVKQLHHDANLRTAVAAEGAVFASSADLDALLLTRCAPTTSATTSVTQPGSDSAGAAGAGPGATPLSSGPGTPTAGTSVPNAEATATSSTTTAVPTAEGAKTSTSLVTTTTLPPFEAAQAKLDCAANLLNASDRLQLVPNWRKRWSQREDFCDFFVTSWKATWSDYGIFGRLITLLALSFGAQFWFDVLRRLTGLRNHLAPSG